MSHPQFERQLAQLAGSAGQAAQPMPAGSIRRRAQRRTAGRAVAAGLLTLGVLGGVGFGVVHQMAHGSAPLSTPPSGAASGSPSAPTADPSLSPVPGQPVPSGSGDVSSAQIAKCTVDRLTITAGGHDAASGHRGFILVFRNTSTTTCRIKGYPGVDAINGKGQLMEHARRTLSGYEGGLAPGGSPQTVSLAPGQSASALVEALAFRASDGSACTPYESLLVTVPDDTVSSRLAWNNDGCSALEVHPVVPGVTGRSG
jgi:hypothetical protein